MEGIRFLFGFHGYIRSQEETRIMQSFLCDVTVSLHVSALLFSAVVVLVTHVVCSVPCEEVWLSENLPSFSFGNMT